MPLNTLLPEFGEDNDFYINSGLPKQCFVLKFLVPLTNNSSDRHIVVNETHS